MYKGISINIGISKLSTKRYRSEGILISPENDAGAMAAIAKQEGYEAIHLLINEEATKTNFLNLFSRAMQTLNNGDTLLLSFSGHGGQVRDAGLDEEDGKDETWCFYDDYLLDDEIGNQWKLFGEGVRIVVVSSSCHSRTALKPYSPHDQSRTPFYPNRSERKKILKPVRSSYPHDAEILASIVHLSACEDRQQARDGERFSVFTETLLKHWDHGGFQGNYEDLIRKISLETGYLQNAGISTLGKNAGELLSQTPFKLLTNKT